MSESERVTEASSAGRSRESLCSCALKFCVSSEVWNECESMILGGYSREKRWDIMGNELV